MKDFSSSVRCNKMHLLFQILFYLGKIGARHGARSALIVFLVTLQNAAFSQVDNELFITQGVASGEVSDDSSVIWSRVNRPAQMHVEYDDDHNFSKPISSTAVANETTDLAAKVKLEGLKPNSQYYYRVWFSSLGDGNGFVVSNVLIGSFRTAPDPLASEQIDFVTSGDLGGQGLCRREDLGYYIFSVMKALSPDFFVFNGDQIYADSDCPKEAPMAVGWKNIEGNIPSISSNSTDWNDLGQLHDIYLKHWEYNRNDTHLQDLLRNTSFYSQFDDHEVIDNYGGNWSFLPKELQNRTGYNNLVRTGISLFSEFSPIFNDEENSQKSFYRSFNWGSGLQLFILDTRSHRSNNILIDMTENNKTLLGKEQLAWLKQGLLESNATWKVISTPNPITISTCSRYGCDSWATNGTDNRTFARERSDLLTFLDSNNIRNILFLTTDVHFPANILVNQDFDGDGDNLIFHELVTGPLSAIPLHSKNLDPTINATFLYNESSIFNFGHISVSKDNEGMGKLISRVIDENGFVRPGSILSLSPQ